MKIFDENEYFSKQRIEVSIGISHGIIISNDELLFFFFMLNFEDNTGMHPSFFIKCLYMYVCIQMLSDFLLHLLGII
jgi:hypothetical protein